MVRAKVRVNTSIVTAAVKIYHSMFMSADCGKHASQKDQEKAVFKKICSSK